MKRNMIRLILILSAVAQSTWSQKLIENPLLDSLVAEALVRNPGYGESLRQARSAMFRVSPAGALPDPMAMIELQGPTNNSWVRETMASPAVSVGLSQMIPFPGKQGEARKSALRGAQAMTSESRAYAQELAMTIKMAYFELAYWRQSLLLIEQNIALLDDLETVVREKYRTGTAMQIEVLQAQTSRVQLENMKLMAEQMISESTARMAQLINVRQLPEIRAAFADDELVSIDTTALFAALENQSPEIQKMQHEIEMRQSMLKMAKLEYWPDFTIGASYGFRWKDEMMADPGTDMFMVSLGFNLPLWGAWKQKNLVSSARAEVNASELGLQQMKNELRFQLKKAVFEYGRYRAQYALYEDRLIPQTLSKIESARAAYQVGSVEFMDVIMAQMELNETQISAKKAFADAMTSLATIEMLIGTAAPVNSGNNEN